MNKRLHPQELKRRVKLTVNEKVAEENGESDLRGIIRDIEHLIMSIEQ